MIKKYFWAFVSVAVLFGYGIYFIHAINQKMTKVIKPPVIINEANLLKCSLLYKPREGVVSIINSSGVIIYQGSLKNKRESLKTVAALYAMMGKKEIVQHNLGDKINFEFRASPH